jgi:hypothetical protein
MTRGTPLHQRGTQGAAGRTFAPAFHEVHQRFGGKLAQLVERLSDGGERRVVVAGNNQFVKTDYGNTSGARSPTAEYGKWLMERAPARIADAVKRVKEDTITPRVQEENYSRQLK